MPKARRKTGALAGSMALLAPIALGCVAAAGAAPPRKPADKGAAEQRPNVVLIVLDTVRADHLGAHGYDRDTTPNIDALARHAVRYTRAVSTAPWTLPSHASMFTGLAPHAHGAHTFRIEEPGNDVAPLGEDLPVIAETFRAHGYATAALSANNVFLTPRWGLARGFDTYRAEHRYADAHHAKVVSWLDERAEEPFFLFVNYIDAHRPYNTRQIPGFLPRVHRDGRLIDLLRLQVMRGDPFPEELARQVIDQYDTGLRHMDGAVGDLILELDRRGMRQRTVIVITSDHGEYFGEHAMVEHNMDVYQPGVHVPLIVAVPGRAAGEDHTLITSADLPWLLASALPDKELRAALARFGDGPEATPRLVENYYSRPWDVFSELWGHRFRRVRRGLYDWPYKLIHSSDGAHELYDLSEDAAELRDLAERDPARVARMAAEVEALTHGAEARVRRPDRPLDDLEIEQMRALGYVE